MALKDIFEDLRSELCAEASKHPFDFRMNAAFEVLAWPDLRKNHYLWAHCDGMLLPEIPGTVAPDVMREIIARCLESKVRIVRECGIEVDEKNRMVSLADTARAQQIREDFARGLSGLIPPDAKVRFRRLGPENVVSEMFLGGGAEAPKTKAPKKGETDFEIF